MLENWRLELESRELFEEERIVVIIRCRLHFHHGLLLPLLLLSTVSVVMESLQGPFNNPYFSGEHLNLESFEEGKALGFSNVPFLNTESLKHGEAFSNPIIFQDKMSFQQMLEEVDFPSLSVPPLTEPNFHILLTLQQQKKLWKQPPLELESCITHVSELQSPVKSENKDQQFPYSSSCLEAASSVCNRENSSPDNCKGEDGNSDSPFGSVAAAQFSKQPPMQEKRKRKKRPRPSKNREEIESQRMTHIAVERNRRKQMNDHLNALRSLMPTSFIQRGDQASIVGGAIDFIKELEQLLQSLQARKLRHQTEEEGFSPDSSSSSAFNSFFTSPQYKTYSSSFQTEFKYPFDGFMAESKSAVADIEVTVIQTHVNLKILSRRRPGQLLKAIVALEKLCLVILHLNVTSSERAVLYSFNLKIEEGCKLGSADEIATAVYQIFSFIDGH